MWLLVARWPLWTKTEDIIYFCYGHDEGGGPISAANNVAVVVHRLRKKMADTLWGITSWKGEGYKLTPLAPQNT